MYRPVKSRKAEEIIKDIQDEYQQSHTTPWIIGFSGGKDSIVVTHLAEKAFGPAKIPMPLVHIDTGHNFSETIEFRDNLVDRLGANLIVGSVQKTIGHLK